jgi:hypothetical protein
MIGTKLKWAQPRRPVRPVLLAVPAAAVVLLLLGACSAEPGTGSTGAGGNSATVNLDPPSGRVNLTVNWATTAGCPAGLQGSAVFRIVNPQGYTFSVAQANSDVTAPFQGTMLAPLGIIQDDTYVPNGSTAEMVIVCFSGQSLTGTQHREMSTYVTFSANGFNYTSSSTAPAGFIPAPHVSGES